MADRSAPSECRARPARRWSLPILATSGLTQELLVSRRQSRRREQRWPPLPMPHSHRYRSSPEQWAHFDRVAGGPAMGNDCRSETQFDARHLASKRSIFRVSNVAQESAVPTSRLQSSASFANRRLTASVGQPQALLVRTQSSSRMHWNQVGFRLRQDRKGSVCARAMGPTTICATARTVERHQRSLPTLRRPLAPETDACNPFMARKSDVESLRSSWSASGGVRSVVTMRQCHDRFSNGPANR